MLKRIVTLYLLTLCLSGYAQNRDSVHTAEPDSLYQSKRNQLDSVKQRTKEKYDKVKGSYDSVGQKLGNSVSRVKHKADSLRNINLMQLSGLDSIQRQTKAKFAKLKSEYDSVGQKIASSISRIKQRIDSLGTLKLPTEKLNARIDSLTKLKEAKLAGLKSKTEALKARSIKKLDSLKLPPRVKKELKKFTKGLTKLDIGIPGTDLNFPKIKSLGIKSNLAIPGVKVPSLASPSASGINTSLPDGVGELKTGGVGKEVKELGGEVKEVTDKLKNPPKKEEVVAKVEEKVGESTVVKNATEKLGVPKDMPLADGQLTKEELQKQAAKQAIDHFAGKEKLLMGAMSQMSKLKQKHSSVQSIKDLPKKIPNPMKDMAFIERVVPGILFHVQNKKAWLLDLNPYAGYRITGKLNAGMGWNYRLALDVDQREIYPAKAYGPRIYIEYDLFRGFQPRIELEVIRAYIPSLKIPGELGERQWVKSMFVGLNKKYKISKSIKGTSSVMYTMFDVHHKSPYGDKIVLRFGVEVMLKKKVKKKAAKNAEKIST